MFLSFDQEDWWIGKIRLLVANIDEIVYKLIGWIFEGIFSIANLSVNSELTITIYKRIYVLLGVYMIFKLSFSFIKYMISPDSMNDKEQGTGKLVVRIITMLAILILLPTIFFEDELLGRVDVKNPDTGVVENVPRGPILNVLQNGIIKTVPKIILGKEDSLGDTGSVQNNASKYGESLAIMMLGTFYYPVECASPDNGGGTKEECEAKKINQIATLADFRTTITEATGSYYDYHYMWPLTLVVGIAMVVILLGIIVDIAVRVFKMMILQMVAPIPVMSYIDPKSSKDGAFNSWLKTFVSTYLDIFIKLLSVYLILLLCSEMMKDKGLFNSNIVGEVGSTKSFVLVFLVIGLFKFAKDIPKFIKAILGIKDTGGGGLFGGLKTLGTAAGLVGGAALGFAAGTVGKGAAIRASVQKAKAEGKSGLAAGLKSSLGMGGSMLSGLVRGGSQGFKGAAKGNALSGFSHAISAQTAVNQRNLAAAMGGSTALGRLGTRASSFFTGETPAERDENMINDYKAIIDETKNFKSVVSDSALKTKMTFAIGNGGRQINLAKFNAVLTAANSGDEAAKMEIISLGYTTHDASGNIVADMAAANLDAKRIQKSFETEYCKSIFERNKNNPGSITDDNEIAIISSKEVIDTQLSSLGLTYRKVDSKNAGKIIGEATNKINAIKATDKFTARKANAAAVKKNGK